TGQIALLEGDAAAAERCLRGAYEGFRSQGLGIDAARAAAFLGRALLVHGRGAEAEALSHESEALAGDDLDAAITWRGVRAGGLPGGGPPPAGAALARAAAHPGPAPAALLLPPSPRRARAAALRAAGGGDEAAAEGRRPMERGGAKGPPALVERTRRG